MTVEAAWNFNVQQKVILGNWHHLWCLLFGPFYYPLGMPRQLAVQPTNAPDKRHQRRQLTDWIARIHLVQMSDLANV